MLGRRLEIPGRRHEQCKRSTARLAARLARQRWRWAAAAARLRAPGGPAPGQTLRAYLSYYNPPLQFLVQSMKPGPKKVVQILQESPAQGRALARPRAGGPLDAARDATQQVDARGGQPDERGTPPVLLTFRHGVRGGLTGDRW